MKPLTEDKIKDSWSGDAEAVAPEDIKSALELLRQELNKLRTLGKLTDYKKAIDNSFPAFKED